MYYEEKVINKVLCYRTTPDGEWEQYSIEQLTAKYDALKLMYEDALTRLNLEALNQENV